jgi:hypothetical protein
MPAASRPSCRGEAVAQLPGHERGGGPGEPAQTGPSKPSSKVMGAGMTCRSPAPVIASGGGGWRWLTSSRTRLGPARRTGRRCRWGRRLSRYELKANSAVLHYLAPWRVTSTAHPQSLHHAAHNNQSCVPLPVVFSVAISAHNGGYSRIGRGPAQSLYVIRPAVRACRRMESQWQATLADSHRSFILCALTY